MRWMIALALALLVAVFPQPGAAQQNAPAPDAILAAWEAEVDQIAAEMQAEPFAFEEIDDLRTRLAEIRSEIPAFDALVEQRASPLRQQIEALGAPPTPESGAPPEAPEITAERTRLGEAIASNDALAKRASQLDARAVALIDELLNRRRAIFTDQLVTRGPSVLEPRVAAFALDALQRTGRIIWQESTYRFRERQMKGGLLLLFLVPLVMIGASLFVLLALKRMALRWLLDRVSEDAPHSRRVLVGAGVTLVRLILPALALTLFLAAIGNSGLLGAKGSLLFQGLAHAAGIVIGAYALGGAFFAPQAPKLRLSVLGECDANAAHLWLMVMAGVVGFDGALVEGGNAMGLSVEGLTLLNTVLLTLGGVGLFGFASALRPPKRAVPAQGPIGSGDEDDAADARPSALVPILFQGARLVARVIAIAAPVLALAGYYAGARFLFYPLLFSGAVIGACILLFHVVKEIVDQIVFSGSAEMPEAPKGKARLRLIPVLVGFLLICVALPVLAIIWGADRADLFAIYREAAEGFVIGGVVISPEDFIVFALVFSIGYIVTRALQGVLARSVLPLTGIDPGARDAICSGIGYIGVILAALAAVSTTGLDLSNLAIVAGALSVGIGFGLQNIVNNFVSGIILLIERPIKAGDWVELPSGMGYVRNVNVRSTVIETFDRSSMFVPNSELISGTVINWTHSNLHGRIIVKVGVAYGTDPRKVERVLMEIAKGHPMLLRRPAPFVLFRGFGADSLNFEIRGVLRDVNWILNVESDLNFEIAKRFAEEGIEIPFRQTDLHLKNVGEIGDSLARALGPAAAPRADGGQT